LGTKFDGVSISGFNSSPPADDGSTADSNKVKWSTIKTKLADPIKTAAESLSSELVTALDQSCRAVSASDSAAASDHDRTIQVNTSSVTITLADAATMAAGYIVSVANQSAGDITVALATSTDTIDSVTNATQTISAKEVRTYIVNSAATGYLTKSDRTVAASDTIAGRIEIAVQSEMEAGSSNTLAVTPGRQHFHPSACKGWVQATPTGVATVSYNVTSVTDTGSGQATITWGADVSSANYCSLVSIQVDSADTTTTLIPYVHATSKAAGTTRVEARKLADASLSDPTAWSVAIFGDFA
jgi:hypothetical protein